MSRIALTLDLLPGRCAVCRLPPAAAIPAWALGPAPLLSITRTAEELSVLCAESAVPAGVQAEAGWRALKVRGPLDFSLTGILAALAVPLAQAGMPIFAVSSYDTDAVLVPQARLEQALAALRACGHVVECG